MNTQGGKILAAAAVAILLQVCGVMNVAAQSDTKGSSGGMFPLGKIEYSMSVGPIKAGRAVLTAKEISRGGQRAYQIEMVASTNKTASRIYYMNDTLRSTMSSDLSTAEFWKHSREENYESIESAKVDGHSIKLCKNRISKHSVQENTQIISTPVYDMMSILVAARGIGTSGMAKGSRREYNIVDGLKITPVFLEYQGVDKIKAAGRNMDCKVFAVIQTKTENGRTRQSELMKIYIGADANALPVGIDISLGLGAAKARML